MVRLEAFYKKPVGVWFKIPFISFDVYIYTRRFICLTSNLERSQVWERREAVFEAQRLIRLVERILKRYIYGHLFT